MTLGKFMAMGGVAIVFACLTGTDGLCAAALVGTTVHLKPAGVIVESGNSGQTLSVGYTTMETATVFCPSGYGCVLGLNAMQAVGQATCTNEWGIVGLVDGNSVDGGTLVDALPGAGKTQTHNWQGSYSVSYGNHTVAFQTYVPCPTTAYQWTVRYLITKF